MTKYFTERADGQFQMVASDNMQMTDRETLNYVNGYLSAIEDMSMDRMKAAVVKLRAEIKKHLGVE